MKADEARSQTPRKHVLEHELPTVIHDPEAEMSALARWLRHAMENPLQFWGGVGLVVAVILALSVLANGLPYRAETTNEAWSRLESAKTAAERVEIAKEFRNTPAERWALLQAASEYYDKGFRDLPANKDAAGPSLKRALDLFEQVAAEAPQDSIQARVAALGVGRTLEARNELEKAIQQYEKVAQTAAWSGTDEAKSAERLAIALKNPEVVAFYDKLYKFESTKATLPADGIGNIEIPFGHPTGEGSAKPDATGPKTSETVPLVLPPLPTDEKPTPKPEPTGNLPSDVFTPGTAPKDAPKPDDGAPKAANTPGLPNDVFSPSGKPDQPK